MRVKRLYSEHKGAYLTYKIHKNEKIWEVLHVYVPKMLRGCKIAEKLTKEVLIQASKHNVLVKPTCTYVSETFLKRFPESASSFVPS